MTIEDYRGMDGRGYWKGEKKKRKTGIDKGGRVGRDERGCKEGRGGME